MRTWLVMLVALTVALPAGARAGSDERSRKVEKIAGGLTNPDLPGLAVMVRENGRTVFEQGFGVRELRTHAPIGPRTDFRLASCTKQFTAMAVMLLVHDGKLRYDEPLTEIFPEFPAYGRAITVRNLLNHTGGLPDYEDLMDKVSAAQPAGTPPKWDATHQIQDAEVLKLIEAQTAGDFAPGTKWSYSNSGYVVLGAVVAKVTGEPFAKFLHDRIFAPLKMTHTVAYERGVNEVRERAYGHSKTESGGIEETDQSSTSATLGDGGVYSNLEDLAKWDDALARHTLLSAAEMKPALTPVRLADGSEPQWHSDPGDENPQPDRPLEYGFGWFLDPYKGHARMWHYGETLGFRTAIMRFRKEKLTIVVLCNRADLKAGPIAEQIADIYLK